MQVQMIYKKSLYDNLSLMEKFMYILGGGSKCDTLEAFTKNRNIAELYLDINLYKNLYIVETEMSESEYIKLRTYNGYLKINMYKTEDGDMLIIKNKDREKFIKEGVYLYDNS